MPPNSLSNFGGALHSYVVFILDDRNNPVVMRDICDTELLYKSLTTNNRRHVKRILRDLTYEGEKH